MKVYLDTNVLVSALTARGLCADLVRVLLAEHELMTGEVNLAELRRVLVGRFGASAALASGVESQLRDQTVVAKPRAADGSVFLSSRRSALRRAGRLRRRDISVRHS